MLLRNIVIFLLFITGTCGIAVAQNVAGVKDVPDVYQKIETFSTKRKITQTLHGFLIKPVSSFICQPTPVEKPGPSEIYAGFEGKIIRRINIVTLDPFGYSITDTAIAPHDFLSKTGNTLHVKTQHAIIRNRLLIQNGDRFDSLLVRESERLIRSQSFIQDVAITAALTTENSDSVDIFIRARDMWTIIPDGAISNNSATFKLSDKNLGGFGHTFSNTYTQNYINGNNAYSLYYYVPNIRNTYINSRVSYALDENRNYYKSINFERPFFSPVTRWAGGLFVSQQKKPDWVYKNDTTRLLLTSKSNIQDYWIASAWQVFKGNSETDRTTKLILSFRFFNNRYLEKPLEQTELFDYYTSERFYMSGLGISSRKYVRQTYIFRFGTTEDVPVGFAYGLVGGYQLKNHERWYWGLHYSWGNFFNIGYFGSNLEYGTFINATAATQGVLTASLSYFSGLFSIGNWKFRQFAKPEVTIGINRASYDRLTLNDGYGLNGFNSPVLSGTSRFLLVLQTQSYAPWNLLGFRFGPYINLSFGMLGSEATGFSHSRMYPQIGAGVLIRNDYLVIKYFQFSFAYYPSIPGMGDNEFKGNPFRTTDFGFQDFILGKPEIVNFQ
jgi:hypothetical protein